jgi:hypothetical protein
MTILNDEECQRISTFLIPLWQSQVFLDQSGGILQNWGVAASVDVMLNPRVGVGFTSLVLKMVGYF